MPLSNHPAFGPNMSPQQNLQRLNQQVMVQRMIEQQTANPQETRNQVYQFYGPRMIERLRTQVTRNRTELTDIRNVESELGGELINNIVDALTVAPESIDDDLDPSMRRYLLRHRYDRGGEDGAQRFILRVRSANVANDRRAVDSARIALENYARTQEDANPAAAQRARTDAGKLRRLSEALDRFSREVDPIAQHVHALDEQRQSSYSNRAVGQLGTLAGVTALGGLAVLAGTVSAINGRFPTAALGYLGGAAAVAYGRNFLTTGLPDSQARRLVEEYSGIVGGPVFRNFLSSHNVQGEQWASTLEELMPPRGRISVLIRRMNTPGLTQQERNEFLDELAPEGTPGSIQERIRATFESMLAWESGRRELEQFIRVLNSSSNSRVREQVRAFIAGNGTQPPI